MSFSFDVGGDPDAPSPPPQERRKPALRLVVLADLGAGDAKAAPVDKDSFADYMQHHGGRLLFEVHNHLGRQPAELAVELEFRDLKAFTPAGIVPQVPELARTLEFRDRLLALQQGRLSRPEFERGLERYRELTALAAPLRLLKAESDTAAPSPPPPAAPGGKSSAAAPGGGDDALDRIFDMVSGPAQPPAEEPAMDRFRQAISNIAGSGRKAAPRGVGGAIELTQEIAARQLDAILHHPPLQAREAAWRGLRLLVEHTDFRAGAVIEVIDAPPDAFADAFRQQVVGPESRGESDAAPALVVVDFLARNRAPDLELLQALGGCAEEIQAPLLAGLHPEFLGLENGSGAAALPYLGTVLSESTYDKWNSLRGKDESRWLALAFNRPLLRGPHAPAGRRTLGLIESVREDADRLWGNPAWVIASLVSASFARGGWPTEFTGTRNGSLEGLDVRAFTVEGGREMQIPLESFLPDKVAEDLAGAGIVPLLCRPDRDAAYVLRAPVVHRPEVYGDESMTAASRNMAQLPYQLLVAAIADAVGRRKAALVAGADEATLRRNFQKFLWGMVAGTGPGAAVTAEIQPHPAGGGRQVLGLRVRTGREVLGGAEVQLAFPL